MGFSEAYRHFVGQHPNATLWHEPDFLEALAPRTRWAGYEGVVLLNACGEVDAVVPVYRKRRLDGLVARVPPFGRYASPLTREEGAAGLAASVAALQLAWAGCTSVDHVLPPGRGDLVAALRTAIPGLGHRDRTTYLIDVDGPAEEVMRRASKGKRKHLRKAAAYWGYAQEGLRPAALTVLEEPFRRAGTAVPYDNEVLYRIATALAPSGRVSVGVARSPSDLRTIEAVSFSVADRHAIYCLHSGSTDAARDHDGGSFVLAKDVAWAAELGVPLLDFLGSDLKGPAQNRRDLGGRGVGYTEVWLDRGALGKGVRKRRG